MKKGPRSAISLVSSSARVQFAIGIALISVIPLLAFLYLDVTAENLGVPGDSRSVAVLVMLVTLSLSGYTILRKYPVNIVRLRGYLERIIRGELPDQVNLVRAEDDIRAVEKCLNLLIGQLRERLQILQDEKKTLQEQLYQVQKMESLGVMAAGVAHDFNNILMGMMTTAELMSDSLPDDPFLKQSLADIQEFIQKAADLTNQMLVYAGRGRFEMQIIDVSKLIREMKQLMEASIGKSVTVEYALTEPIPYIHADPTQIRQVVMNLVINGSDAVGEKPGKVTVSSRLERPDAASATGCHVWGALPQVECVCIEVADTGCGLDPAKMQRIFDPFFTTKTKGKGLGLAIVLGIVKTHKGAILASSELGKGTRFRVYLPVADSIPALA